MYVATYVYVFIATIIDSIFLQQFDSFGESFISLYILLTTAKYVCYELILLILYVIIMCVVAIYFNIHMILVYPIARITTNMV